MLKEGLGAAPRASDTVTAHYAGWLADGTLFDSSFEGGAPADFPLGGVIAGWTEGLQLMREGGEAIFVIPSNLAYGPGGRPPVIPPAATLVFLVHLHRVGG
jgi:FKBP-type peptidyl-prolyl cis-trans isomerase